MDGLGKEGDGKGPGGGKPSDAAQYGLLGLLGVIRMVDADVNTLALGSDLTTLGLNLNSSKSLYSSFSSPWTDGPASASSEPQFTLPSCYYMTKPPPLGHHYLQKFQLETLFHIFYAMPKDLLQAYAAQELYQREWRYHMELKLWFRRATHQDLPHMHAERAQAQYVFFDINSWECRLFSGNAHVVSSGLMSEEEVRVRQQPGSAQQQQQASASSSSSAGASSQQQQQQQGQHPSASNSGQGQRSQAPPGVPVPP